MAITKFQPEVWSATLLSILEKSLVYAGSPCVNRNYEGDICAVRRHRPHHLHRGPDHRRLHQGHRPHGPGSD